MPLIDLLRLTGILGFLAAILYPTCVLLAALFAGSRERSHRRALSLFALTPALIGISARALKMMTANRRLEGDYGPLFAGDLAEAYSQWDAILFTGLGTSAICYLLLSISFLRDPNSTAKSFFLALSPALILFAASLQTADIRNINRKISTTNGALIEDLLPRSSTSYGSSSEFALTEGPLKPEYEQAKQYLEYGSAASAGLLILALAAWSLDRRSRRKLLQGLA
jgi:hypothetical protein